MRDFKRGQLVRVRHTQIGPVRGLDIDDLASWVTANIDDIGLVVGPNVRCQDTWVMLLSRRAEVLMTNDILELVDVPD